jgi:hypothetical protein
VRGDPALGHHFDLLLVHVDVLEHRFDVGDGQLEAPQQRLEARRPRGQFVLAAVHAAYGGMAQALFPVVKQSGAGGLGSSS